MWISDLIRNGAGGDEEEQPRLLICRWLEWSGGVCLRRRELVLVEVWEECDIFGGEEREVFFF